MDNLGGKFPETAAGLLGIPGRHGCLCVCVCVCACLCVRVCECACLCVRGCKRRGAEVRGGEGAALTEVCQAGVTHPRRCQPVRLHSEGCMRTTRSCVRAARAGGVPAEVCSERMGHGIWQTAVTVEGVAVRAA